MTEKSPKFPTYSDRHNCMYSNMKYYENICNCLRVIQQDINRKLKFANCWQQTSLNGFNGPQLTERTRNSIANDQREITPKIPKAELWFLRMTHRLIVLYNGMKFHLNSFNSCQLTERTRNSTANYQREISPKISKAELWFLCMTHCLIVCY